MENTKKTLTEMLSTLPCGVHGDLNVWVDEQKSSSLKLYAFTEDNFPTVSERFTTKGVELLHIDAASTEEVFSEIERRGYRPGSIEELIAFGAEKPEAQYLFDIIALGSIWKKPLNGGENVPYLALHAGVMTCGPYLGTCALEIAWHRGLERRFIAVRKEARRPPAEPTVEVGYKVTVDWTKSLTDAVADGRYEDSHPHLPMEEVSPKGDLATQPCEAVLVHYGRYMTMDEIKSDLEERCLRPATLRELLAFGHRFPGVQRRFRIAALGTIWKPNRHSETEHTAVLSSWQTKRRLDSNWLHTAHGWCEEYRFLAIRR